MQARLTQFHTTSAKSVREFGYFEDKNFPNRQNMEDFYIAQDDFYGDGSGLFAILDGHGGAQVSQFCSSVIPNILEQQMSKSKGKDIRGAIIKSMARTDEQLKLVGASDTGSTCCLALIRNEGNTRRCYVANLGDTRAVVNVQGVARRVSVDHKPTAQGQIDRIKKEGGVILKGRVSGQLAVTRALGDLELKSQGVSIVPDIQEFEITDKTKFLIIASDGLWDVCEDQKSLDILKNQDNTVQMAAALVKHAKALGSKDNVSVLVIKF